MTMIHVVRTPLLLALAVLSLSAPRRVEGLVASAEIAQGQKSEVALSLRNPGSHPKIGLPDFVLTAVVDATVASHARTVADVLWNDLDFEREYYMIPRPASASIPAASVASLPYDRWMELDAQFVLVGEASASNGNLVVQLRLVSVRAESRGQVAFAMQYECGVATARGPRDCAHQIADDFHKETRGLDGVARTRIAFTSDRDSVRVTGRPSQTAAQGKEIYIADYDGANPIRFTVNRSLNISPAWSPDGGLLAYTSYAFGGFPDILVANLREPGRGLSRPAGGTDRVHNQMAAWSPDGSRLAFMSNRSGNNDIWIVNRDGTGLQQLTSHPLADLAPTWSPDGNQIAFISDRAGANQLYTMTSLGTSQRRVTEQKADRPTWSSLNFIAFSIGGGPHDIAIYDFETDRIMVLTNGVGTNEGPSVSPNGRHIAFFTTRWGQREIAVMDRAGQRIKRITEVGNNTYPNWQPTLRR